jgi:cytochrome c biogenesis protein CcdA
MMALAVFLMIYLNQPIYPIIIGILIAVPGVVLFLRFLQKYPLQREGAKHEKGIRKSGSFLLGGD